MTRLQSLPSQQHSSGLQRPRQSLRKTRAWANHIAHHCCAGFPQQSYNHQADHANSFATLLHAPAGHRQIDARIPRAAAAWDESADAINMHIYLSLSLSLCVYMWLDSTRSFVSPCHQVTLLRPARHPQIQNRCSPTRHHHHRHLTESNSRAREP